MFSSLKLMKHPLTRCLGYEAFLYKYQYYIRVSIWTSLLIWTTMSLLFYPTSSLALSSIFKIFGSEVIVRLIKLYYFYVRITIFFFCNYFFSFLSIFNAFFSLFFLIFLLTIWRLSGEASGNSLANIEA